MTRISRSPTKIGSSAVVGAALFTIVLAGCGGGSSSGTGGVTGGDFHSLVADPSTAGRIYAGGHSKVSRSDDGGRTWAVVEALDDADAMGWAIEPNQMWVSGHPGLNVSVDGGVSFERRNAGLPDTDVHAFGAAGNLMFAAGPGLGFAGSSDGGATWATLSSASGQAFFGRILIDPTDADHLVAGDVQSGASVSRDGGRTWTPLGSNPASWVSSPDGLITIYASGGELAQFSRNGGESWATMTLPAGATLVEASKDGPVYTGVHERDAVTVWVSSDDGITWNKP